MVRWPPGATDRRGIARGVALNRRNVGAAIDNLGEQSVRVVLEGVDCAVRECVKRCQMPATGIEHEDLSSIIRCNGVVCQAQAR